ncbi:hypothetical protein BU24DRAFT_103785 [Aaosphaeria arxii CBS 175.79]|uniref:Uncharacterized protein n=1 Tax=Aaosphaeria arxii CBS 175.79 TaxID=1450172 RepID=A0A6A5Y0E7_9PLEO|nr:uncharacterized protein BU24DRAFT_103785 [Aaosphaeria arxii CBS 175.79]KAF2018729.1 hypothetical protein BU24DRAFT_103785 [Aaosphaeria arxii CBS 175.79]
MVSDRRPAKSSFECIIIKFLFQVQPGTGRRECKECVVGIRRYLERSLPLMSNRKRSIETEVGSNGPYSKSTATQGWYLRRHSQFGRRKDSSKQVGGLQRSRQRLVHLPDLWPVKPIPFNERPVIYQEQPTATVVEGSRRLCSLRLGMASG